MNIKTLVLLTILSSLTLCPSIADSSKTSCLAPNSRHKETLSLNVYLDSNPDVQFLDLIEPIVKYKGNKVQVRLTASNGNQVTFPLPAPQEVPRNTNTQIFVKYVAGIYARNFALGNPGPNLYLEITDTKGARQEELESQISTVITSEFKKLGAPLFNKANGGKKIAVSSRPANFKAKPIYGKLKTPIRYLSQEELSQGKTPTITLGFDTGGQGTGVAVMVNGKDITDKLFPESDTEELDQEQDKSLRYRYSYGFDHLKDGGTGQEFRERLVNYVKEVTEAVKEKLNVENIHGVYVSMPGAPDYANERMGSIGNLSRGFPSHQVDENLAQANQYISDLKDFLGENVSFGFGNDMVGWGLAISEEAGFEDGIGIITGSGIGVMMLENGRDVPGANEGGHQSCFPNRGTDPKNPDSVQGSFEIFGGSIPGILRISESLKLSQQIEENFQIPKEKINVKHLGFIAAGRHPNNFDQSINESHPEIKSQALELWKQVEEIEAQHVISLYLLTGKTQFAFGGGTTRGDTGKIRYQYLREALDKYLEKLDLPKDLIEVKLVSANAALGAAKKALQVYQEDIARKALAKNVLYQEGEDIKTLQKAMKKANKTRLWNDESWKSQEKKLPSNLVKDIQSLFPEGKKFHLLQGEDSYLLIDDKGYKVVGFYKKEGKQYYNLIYKHGADLLFPKVNRQVLDEQGRFRFKDSQGKTHKIPVLDEALVKAGFVTKNPIGQEEAPGERHGHVRKKSFKVSSPKLHTNGAIILRGTFDFKEAFDEAGISKRLKFYQLYAGLSLEVDYILKDGVWSIKARSINQSDHEIPVAFCPHYWLNMNLNGEIQRSDVRVTMLDQLAKWEDNEETHIPHFKAPVPMDQLKSNVKTKHDMRKGLKMGDKTYNHVYHMGNKDIKTVLFDLPGLGRTVMKFGRNMENFVFFIPGEVDGAYVHDVDTIAAEPTSSGVNYAQMAEAGIKETNMILSKPGETHTFETALLFQSLEEIMKSSEVAPLLSTIKGHSA